MRLFVAVDLTDSVRERVTQFMESCRPRCPRARWMRSENMHITVKFVGWVPDEKLGAFHHELDQVRASEPAQLVFRGTGFFPNPTRPRVFWIGVHHSPNLAQMAIELDQRFKPLGIEPEKRSFHPHLTLARFESPVDLDPLRTALREAGEMDFGSFRTNLLHLYQSQLRRGGAEYTRLASFDFLRDVAA